MKVIKVNSYLAPRSTRGLSLIVLMAFLLAVWLPMRLGAVPRDIASDMEGPGETMLLETLEVIDISQFSPSWMLRAERSRIVEEKGRKIAYLEGVEVVRLSKNGEDFVVKAKRGTYFADQGQITGEGEVTIRSSVKGETSKKNAKGMGQEFLMKGRGFLVDIKNRRVSFSDGLTSEVVDGKGGSFSVVGGRGYLDMAAREIHYEDKVVARGKNSMSVKSHELVFNLAPDSFFITGGRAKGAVEVEVKERGILAHSEQAEFGGKGRGLGEWKVTLIGNPKVLMRGDRIRGERMTIDLKTGSLVVNNTKAVLNFPGKQ